MPGNEESVVDQGSEEMRSPLFEKSVRNADFIHVVAQSLSAIGIIFVPFINSCQACVY